MPKKIVGKKKDKDKEEKRIKDPGTSFTFSLAGILPTKLDLLDRVLGGGIPEGRFTLISGKEGAGKTSLAWHIISQYLNNRFGNVYYIEGEGKPPLEEYILSTFGIGD